MVLSVLDSLWFKTAAKGYCWGEGAPPAPPLLLLSPPSPPAAARCAELDFVRPDPRGGPDGGEAGRHRGARGETARGSGVHSFGRIPRPGRCEVRVSVRGPGCGPPSINPRHGLQCRGDRDGAPRRVLTSRGYVTWLRHSAAAGGGGDVSGERACVRAASALRGRGCRVVMTSDVWAGLRLCHAPAWAGRSGGGRELARHLPPCHLPPCRHPPTFCHPPPAAVPPLCPLSPAPLSPSLLRLCRRPPLVVTSHVLCRCPQRRATTPALVAAPCASPPSRREERQQPFPHLLYCRGPTEGTVRAETPRGGGG